MAEIGQARLSGSLRLSDKDKKSILYFKSGKVVFAVSNARSARLFDILLRRNKLTKEDLGQIWEQLDKFSAKMKLLDWHHQAMASGIRILQQFARTLLAHSHGILAWYDHPISNGPLEGTNNKIKTMNRQHYGLRDKEFFQLKLYQLHETKYALVG